MVLAIFVCFKPKRFHFRGCHFQHLSHARSGLLLTQIYINQSHPTLDPNGMKGEFLLRDLIQHPWRALQGSVEAIDPVMIATAERADISTSFLDDARPSMPANIEKSAEFAFLSAEDDDAFTHNRVDKKISRSRDLAFVANIEPLSKEHLFNVYVAKISGEE